MNSSGSVIPKFIAQVRNGGPVTVTHPEIVRYFMTIKEATELVVQASSMAKGGEVFLLDMGEPVKLTQLAENLISITGKTPIYDGQPGLDEIKIVFSGLRPGEKMFEELLFSEESIETSHVKIRKAYDSSVDIKKADYFEAEIKRALETRNLNILTTMLSDPLVGYGPEK
ncbi:polysaccharide biosynthesis protein [Luminiphilus sp.]|nr:polysaccharide biosynthesis protein [Luminiphilus sp.]